MPRGEPLPLPFWPMARRWSATEGAVASFLWTCRERAELGREGLFAMTAETVALGLPEAWGLERVTVGLEGLQGRGWVLCDRGWMFITSAMEHVKVSGDRTVQAAVNRVKDAPRDSFLWTAFADVARDHAPELFERLFLIQALAPTAADDCPKVGAELAPTVSPKLAPKEAEFSDDSPQLVHAREASTPVGAPTPGGMRDTTHVNPLEWRLSLGLSVEEMAAECAVTVEAVRAAEAGFVEIPVGGTTISVAAESPEGRTKSGYGSGEAA